MKHNKNSAILIITFLVLIAGAMLIHAIPSGPQISIFSNETKSVQAARVINTSGGSITTIRLNATTQNTRWKAYVGNVTGTLTLDDANDNTIFNWQLTSIVGEVYATRSSGLINWSGINCSNSSNILYEETNLSQFNKDDNISKTFSSQTHQGFYAGTRQILQNTCYSVHTYVNSTAQSTRFEEVVLYDSPQLGNGNIVYATPLE